MNEILKRVEALRIKADMDIVDLCAIAGISSITYSLWAEKGSAPNVAFLMAIAKGSKS